MPHRTCSSLFVRVGVNCYRLCPCYIGGVSAVNPSEAMLTAKNVGGTLPQSIMPKPSSLTSVRSWPPSAISTSRLWHRRLRLSPRALLPPRRGGRRPLPRRSAGLPGDRVPPRDPKKTSANADYTVILLVGLSLNTLGCVRCLWAVSSEGLNAWAMRNSNLISPPLPRDQDHLPAGAPTLAVRQADFSPWTLS